MLPLMGTAWAITGAGAGWLAGTGGRLLLGRLRRGVRVAPPWCELGVASLWALAGWWLVEYRFATAWLAVLLGLAWLAVMLSATDLVHRRLPDALTLPALPVAVVLLVPLGAEAVARGMVGAVLLGAAHAAVHLVAPRAMGAGDVKLAAPLGAVLGACSSTLLLLAPLLAAVLTALPAVVGLAAGRLRRWDPLPHGPAMLLAAWGLALLGAPPG